MQAELLVTIEKDQYEPKLQNELKKYQQKAQMKGFRKGRVPMSVIKKMYGKAVLADVVNEQVQSELSGYFESEKLDILGQPLPSTQQRSYDFGLNNLDDFEFSFDIGLAPEFELNGLTKDTTFIKPVVIVSDEMIDEELELAQKRKGKEIHPEKDFKDTDVLLIEATEVVDDGDTEAHQTKFRIMLNRIADEDLRKEILKKKIGERINFDIFSLEKDQPDEYVRKYLLNLKEDEMDRAIRPKFEGLIAEVTRIEPAKLEQEFFDTNFGEGKVNNVEQARQSIKEDIATYYNRQSEALLFRDFQEKLLEMNPVTLPDLFLKRWLVEGNKDLKSDAIEQEYDAFAKNLIWTLIENKIKKESDLTVEQEEVKEILRGRVLQYMGNYPFTPEMLDDTVNRLMGDQEQVRKAYEEKLSDKVFDVVVEAVQIDEQGYSVQDFNTLVTNAQQKAQPPIAEEEE